MSLKNIKEKIHQSCERYIQQRLDTALQAIASAQAAGEGETKSSAGDKFETSREMMKQEIERHQQLLADAKRMERVLEELDPQQEAREGVRPGSLVQTDQGLFYLATGIGKLTVDGTDVFVLSPSAPVGRLLIGTQAGDVITFNGREYHILELG